MQRLFISIAVAVLVWVPIVSLAQVVTFPNRGGLGTTTPPTAGQVPVGQADGTYGPQATSTLGLPLFSDIAGFISDLTGFSTSDLVEGSNLYWTNERFDTRLSATTSLPNLIVTESQISNLDHYGTSDFLADFAAQDTGDLTEGDNLYRRPDRCAEGTGRRHRHARRRRQDPGRAAAQLDHAVPGHVERRHQHADPRRRIGFDRRRVSRDGSWQP